jgi:hypothetical protein
MAHQFDVRQSSLLTAIHKVANRPHRTADHTYIEDGRACLVLVATAAVAINAWALFPSSEESRHDVPLPDTSTPSAADVKSGGEVVVGADKLSRANAFTLMAAQPVSSKPTMYGPAAWYPSPVANVSQVSVRSKLQALLMMLYSQSGVVDPASLEAKLQALLQLPDSVLAQLMEHPDLADLNKTLNAVFLGKTDLSGVKTELDKIDVISMPGPSEKIDVVNVNGKPAYIVHTPAVEMRTVDADGSPVSAPPPPPGEPVTVTVLSAVEAPADLSASAFTVAPSSQQLTPSPAPAGLTAAAFTLAPSSEQLTPPPAPAGLTASAFTLAPSSEQLTPPPAPTRTPEIPKLLAEPTDTPQTSLDVLKSGNMFEPGETATQRSADNSPATNSPATQTATGSTPATSGGSLPEAGGVTGGGGGTSPSNNLSGGTSSGGGTSP